MDDAREYESLSKTYTLSTSNSEQGNDSESQVLTFAELKGLIESGNIALIPNNKIIPDRLNVGRADVHHKHRFMLYRRKHPQVNRQLLLNENPGKALRELGVWPSNTICYLEPRMQVRAENSYVL